MQQAQKLLNNPKMRKFQNSKIEQVYIIFDKDDLSLQNLRDAKKEAERLGYEIGFSNESIELWILLHFQFVTKAYHRDELKQEISKYINREYDKKAKADEQLISSFTERLCIALENAKRFRSELVFDENPYTNIGYIIKKIYET